MSKRDSRRSQSMRSFRRKEARIVRAISKPENSTTVKGIIRLDDATPSERAKQYRQNQRVTAQPYRR